MGFLLYWDHFCFLKLEMETYGLWFLLTITMFNVSCKISCFLKYTMHIWPWKKKSKFGRTHGVGKKKILLLPLSLFFQRRGRLLSLPTLHTELGVDIVDVMPTIFPWLYFISFFEEENLFINHNMKLIWHPISIKPW